MELDVEGYRAQGFAILKGLLDPAVPEAILREARLVFHRQFQARGYTERPLADCTEPELDEWLFRLFAEDVQCLSNCGKQVQHLISLHRLSLDEKIVSVVSGLGLAHPNVSTRPVLYFNHPRLAQRRVLHTVDAHQDWRSMQGSLNAVVVWVPLVDIDRRLGALEVLPESHRRGLRTDRVESGFGMVSLSDEDERRFVSVELSRGDALAFSSFLVHRSGENVTGSPRWSCHFRYNDLAEPSFVRRGYPHPYVYKPAEELLTPGFPTPADVGAVFP